jgi:hypothetical protein
VRSVYFIGAGFTKALEHRRPVPLMMDFVQVLARYARRNDVCLMTLIGLEAMNVFRHRRPSLRTLAVGLKPKRHRRQLVAGALARPPESIETLLSRAERLDAQIASKALSGKTLFAAINDPELRVQYAISSVFHAIDWRLRFKPIVKFLKQQCSSLHRSHTFVSFNYDLALEHALELARLPWSARRGYSIRFKWAAPADPHPHGGIALVPVPGRRTVGLEVLKPHGSLNWLVPKPVGRSGRRLPVLTVTNTGDVRYPAALRPHSEVRFPNLWHPLTVTPLIVPPSRKKNTSRHMLERLRDREEKALQEADEVYVFGWSMPRTDKDQIQLIRRAVTRRTKRFRRVVVVNWHAANNYYRRVADVLGVSPKMITRYDEGLHQFLHSAVPAG